MEITTWGKKAMPEESIQHIYTGIKKLTMKSVGLRRLEFILFILDPSLLFEFVFLCTYVVFTENYFFFLNFSDI